MSTNRENLENPGIFARILNDEMYEIQWADGHTLIAKAYQEESHQDVSIVDFLRHTSGVHDIEQDDYDEWGTKTTTLTLRSITLREAVHFLGRNARVCAFLRPKPQAVRFINALEKGGSLVELKTAAEMKKLLNKFDQNDEILIAERLSDYLENQLFNITVGWAD